MFCTPQPKANQSRRESLGSSSSSGLKEVYSARSFSENHRRRPRVIMRNLFWLLIIACFLFSLLIYFRHKGMENRLKDLEEQMLRDADAYKTMFDFLGNINRKQFELETFFGNYVQEKMMLDSRSYSESSSLVKNLNGSITYLQNAFANLFNESLSSSMEVLRDLKSKINALENSFSLANEQKAENYDFISKNRLINFACESLHAFVIQDKRWTSLTYENYNVLNYFAGSERVLKNSEQLSDCWKSKGNQGMIGLGVKTPIFPLYFSVVDSPLITNSSLEEVDVFGLILRNQEISSNIAEKEWASYKLASFVLNQESNNFQNDNSSKDEFSVERAHVRLLENRIEHFFPCTGRHCDKEYSTFQIKFKNRGNIEYSCIYKFRVYSTINLDL